VTSGLPRWPQSPESNGLRSCTSSGLVRLVKLQSPGVDIYEAVVDHDVTTSEAFLAWQGRRSAE
jgi:hypothetical protein